MLLLKEHSCLDEQATGSAGGVIYSGVGIGIDDFRHESADFLGSKELAGPLSLALGELAQQVLVCPSQDVRLGVLQPQPMTAQDLNERGKRIIIEGPLAALPLIVVLDVQHALEIRIELGDLTHGSGDELAQPAIGPMVADRLPTVLLGDVEADYGLGSSLEGMSEVSLNDLPGYSFIAIFLHMGGELIIEDIREAFEENQRQDEVLELRGICRTSNCAGRIPEPCLQHRDIQMLIR